MEVSNYLERIAMNDIEAFNELYNLINNNVYSFALSILKNNEDALDVTQEVFITIYTMLLNIKIKINQWLGF